VQPMAVSACQTIISASRGGHGFGYSNMMRLVIATSKLLRRYMCNRQLFLSASDLDMIIDAL